MRPTLLCLVIAIVFCNNISAQDSRIVVEVYSASGFERDSVKINAHSVYDIVDYHYDDKEYMCKVENNRFKWVLFTNYPTYLSLPSKLGNSLLEPGDSVYITVEGGRISYSGRGAKNFQLSKEAFEAGYKPRPPAHLSPLNQYMYVSLRCDSIAAKRKNIFAKYKEELSQLAYTLLEGDYLSGAEHYRTNAFSLLRASRKKADLSGQDLSAIFDSTIARAEVLRLPVNDTSMLSAGLSYYYCREYNYIAYCRSKGFDDRFFDRDKDQIWVGFYHFTKEKYAGLAQRKTLVAALTVYIIRRNGVQPEYMRCVEDFLALPDYGYATQKKYVKEYVDRAILIEEGAYAPDFNLTDTAGKKISLANLKGKVVYMDFWFTGCAGCAQMTPALKKVEQQFKDNPNVVFLSISIDKNRDQWINSIKRGKYTTGHSLNVYTGGLGEEHPILKSYNVSSYPRTFILDAEGRIAKYPAPNPLADSGRTLSALIKKQLAELSDGPYVLYRDGAILTKEIVPNKQGSLECRIDSTDGSMRDKLELTSITDEWGKTFSIRLKESLRPEKSVYDKPSKMFMVSDIEGNFSALRKLLCSNGIIDSNYNWTFGTGHLALVGDFFDRGNQVTECLWLIYSLENKAKEAGGYVHFLLGNHEIMNLNGSLGYIQNKYRRNKALMNEKYEDLWGKDSELGRWLRTKNIIEKIGDILVCHGGISKQINEMDASISEINNIARQYYDREDEAQDVNGRAKFLFSSTDSPFWYRGYYTMDDKPKASADQVDSTLDKFNVNLIVTGHTVNRSGTISTYYDGKVLNTDTHHASGKSEGLLVIGSTWYKASDQGKLEILLTPSTMATSEGKNRK